MSGREGTQMQDIAARPAEAARGGEAAAANRTGLSLPLAMGISAYLLGLVSGRLRLDDPDTMLHVVVGRWIIAHRRVPRVDVLTHSVPGQAWVAHEWLGGIVSALFYDTLGWHGLVAMASLGLGAAIAIFTRALLRYYRPPHAIIIACAAWFVLTPHWLARPHMLALPLLVLWTSWLVRARAENRAPPLWAALLMVPWVNIHGTFLVGVAFAGLLGVEAVLTTRGEAARLKAAKDWAAFTAAAAAAALVTPYGIDAYLLPFQLLKMKFALSILEEWKGVDFQTLTTIEMWLLLFLGVTLLRGLKLPAMRVFFVLLLFVMSLQHIRNGDLIVFMAPLLAGPALARQLGGEMRLGRGDWLERLCEPARARGFALAAALVVAGEAAALAFPLGPPEKYAPVAAVEAAEAADIPATGPVLNDYNFGDYLMFRGIRTFVDGRADMFGDPFLKRYSEAIHGQDDAVATYLDEFGIAWTLFPKDAPIDSALDRLPGWRRFYADDQAAIYVRTAPPAPGGG